jgi:hypothetical protein
MKTDERDERLAELLGRVVDGVAPDTSAGLERVVRRGTRRRVMRTGAAVAAVAVFVGAVALGAGRLGSEANRRVPVDETPSVFAAADFPWTVDVPPGWTVSAVRRVGGDLAIVPDIRSTYVINLPYRFEAVDVAPNSEPLPAEIPDDAVILVIDRLAAAKRVDPEPAQELQLGESNADPQNPGWSWRGGMLCGEPGCVDVLVWNGPDASAEDVRTATRLAEGVRLVRTEPTPFSASPPVTYIDDADGFTVTVPAGWMVSGERINTWVVDPREILAIGSYPLRPGGHPVTDGQVPSNAVDDMGPDDVFIWVNDRAGPGLGDYPPRPRPFSPGTICPDDLACIEGRGQDIEGIRAWWTYFGEEGRGVYVFVGMGEQAYANPETLRQAWAVLDSLRLGPALTPSGGFFEACPALADAGSISSESRADAERAAAAFVRASNEGDAVGLEHLLDPVAVANGIASLESTAAQPVLGSEWAVTDPLLETGCGSDVAARSWRVTIDDGTPSASLDTWLYLIARSDGWKVWGAY